jgi:phage terminase large subunit
VPIYKPHERQKEAHRAFLTDGFKQGVLLWSRQNGKTFWSVNHAWMSAVAKQGRYFIVFPTYKQAKDTVWAQYLHTIPKELIKEVNATDLKVTLHHLKGTLKLPDGTVIEANHDPDLPPSTIELKGSDDADRLRGMKANGIIFDEYAIQEPEHWDSVFRPMFTTTGGWAAFISTPKGFNHFYDMVLRAEANPKSWFLSKSTWRDNPYIDPDYIADTRRDYDDKGELSTFMQEYELEFRSVEGAVYPEFNRDIHVIDPDKVPLEGTIYAGIDFGWENPSAVIFVLIDREDNWYIFDEIYATKTITKDMSQIIKTKLGDKRLTLLVGDSAQQENIEIMRQEALPIVPVSKTTGSIQAGIALVGEKLKPRIQLVGDPKPKMYVSSTCRHFIEEMEGYRYPSKKLDRNLQDVPIKNNDHGCFVAGTIVNRKPIEQIGEYMGNKKVYEYQLGNTTVTVTPDHPILTDRGLVRIDTLRYTDTIWQKRLFTTVTNGQETPVPLSGAIRCITSALARQMQAIGRDSTDMSGGKQTARYPLALIFTTLMAIPSITHLLISAAYSLANTKATTPLVRSAKRMVENKRRLLSKLLPNGQKPKKVKPLEKKWAKKTPSISQGIRLKETATFAKSDTLQKHSLVDGATQTVKPLRYVGVRPTYNLRTKSGMYQANGIVFSNCDAIRYLALHMKYGMEKGDRPIKVNLQFNQYGMLE